MKKIEAYILLFTDSLIGNIAINPSNEFVIHSMKLFGNYNLPLIFLTVIAANIISVSINYFSGKFLKTIFSNTRSEIEVAKQLILRNFFHKYNILLLVLSVIPLFGKFIVVMAAIYNVKYFRIVWTYILFKSIYYSVILLM